MPYARDRYFENHKMLSAVDKLHKLYSTTAEPVVWARSVGLEVLNELDTLKAALMVSAGSHKLNSRGAGGVGMSLATESLDHLASGLNNVKTAVDISAGVVQAGIQQLYKNWASSR